MLNLDLKDRKILYELDLNCRQSNSQIGKKVGLSKKVVNYRINKMQEEGIIKGYWALINSYALGYDVYRYYLILQNITPKIKEEMIQSFVNYKNTLVSSSLAGAYDLSAAMWVKNINEFYRFWEEFIDRFGEYISQKEFSLYLHCNIYPNTCLIPQQYDKSDREKFWQIGPCETVEIDEIDFKLLEIITMDARIPLIDIAEKLNLSSQAVNYRLKNLQNNNVLKAFRTSINYSELGLQWFKVDIWLKQLSKIKTIWNYFQENPYVTYINTSAGHADLEIEFNIESVDKLLEIIDDVTVKFPNVIRKHSYFNVKKQHMLRCIPKLYQINEK